MAKLVDLCEKYFGSRDFYEVLKISKTANDKQGMQIIFNAIRDNKITTTIIIIIIIKVKFRC